MTLFARHGRLLAAVEEAAHHDPEVERAYREAFERSVDATAALAPRPVARALMHLNASYLTDVLARAPEPDPDEALRDAVDDLEPRARYQRAGGALFRGMTDLSPHDRRAAWETARDEAHLAFRLWCDAPVRRPSARPTPAYRAAADREDIAIVALTVN